MHHARHHTHARIAHTQDTITGFLLSGVGNVDIRKKTNYLVVDSSECMHAMHAPGSPGMGACRVLRRV
jgi:hypothetical protein